MDAKKSVAEHKTSFHHTEWILKATLESSNPTKINIRNLGVDYTQELSNEKAIQIKLKTLDITTVDRGAGYSQKYGTELCLRRILNKHQDDNPNNMLGSYVAMYTGETPAIDIIENVNGIKLICENSELYAKYI